MDPKGKIALVTGAAQGIGFAISKALLQNGLKSVTVVDVAKGESAVEQLQKEFGKDCAIFIKSDVSKEDELEDAFKKTIQHFGGLDIVVNNAGIFNGKNWQRMVSINVNGVFTGTILALKYLGKDQLGKGGVVINTGSESGLGNGSETAPQYNGTKSGFLWNATGVRVMCINPGYTESGITAGDIDIGSLILRKEWLPQLQKEFQSRPPPQKAENVGNAVIHMIHEGKPGSLWVSEFDKPVYEIVFPPHIQVQSIIQVPSIIQVQRDTNINCNFVCKYLSK